MDYAVFVFVFVGGSRGCGFGNDSMRSWNLQRARSTSLYDGLRAIVLLKLFLERDNI